MTAEQMGELVKSIENKSKGQRCMLDEGNFAWWEIKTKGELVKADLVEAIEGEQSPIITARENLEIAMSMPTEAKIDAMQYPRSGSGRR